MTNLISLHTCEISIYCRICWPPLTLTACVYCRFSVNYTTSITLFDWCLTWYFPSSLLICGLCLSQNDIILTYTITVSPKPPLFTVRLLLLRKWPRCLSSYVMTYYITDWTWTWSCDRGCGRQCNLAITKWITVS